MQSSTSQNNDKKNDFVPETTKKFCLRFMHALKEKNVREIFRLYSSEFNSISQRYYATESQPTIENLSRNFELNEHFIVFYKELYFRHRYFYLNSSLKLISISQIKEAIDKLDECQQNYINLFNILIQQDSKNLDIELPNKYIWDIVELFLLQYHEWQFIIQKQKKTVQEYKKNVEIFYESLERHTTSTEESDENSVDKNKSNSVNWKNVITDLNDKKIVFCEDQANRIQDLKSILEKENDLLDSNLESTNLNNSWNTFLIFRYFHALAYKGLVNTMYSKNLEHIYDSNTVSNMFKVLGHYAVVGLMRMHIESGNYISALKAIEVLDLDQQFMKIQSCYIVINYYLAFCYMMLHKFNDCFYVLNHLLSKYGKIFAGKQFEDTKNYSQIIIKRVKALYAITYHLSSNRKIEDAVFYSVQQYYKELQVDLSNMTEKSYETLFSEGAPIFNMNICFSTHSKDNKFLSCENKFKDQFSIFAKQILIRKQFLNLHKILKLYTSIPLNKLGSKLIAKSIGFEQNKNVESGQEANDLPEAVNEIDYIDKIISTLVSVKLKTHNFNRLYYHSYDKEYSTNDFDFYVDNDMLFIRESNKQFGYSSMQFLREIDKSDNFLNRLSRLII